MQAERAFLTQGLIELYQSDVNTEWRQCADALQTKQDVLLGENKSGGYFASTGKDPNVLLRVKETCDGAEPSENSVAALNLLRLRSIPSTAITHN